MKKTFLLLAFAFSFLALRSWAQPSFSFLPAQSQLDPGDQICLKLSLDDFTDILSTQFSVRWDPGVIEFQNVTGLNPAITGLDMSDFDLSQAAQGILTFNWSNGQPCNGATSSVTIPDGAGFFNLCFTATGVYGNHTYIEIVEQPLDMVVRRLSANCLDIGEFVSPAFISIGTKPLTINMSSADGFEGDVVCVDFKVKDFKHLVSFQYFIFWDTSVLEFQNATTMNLEGNYHTGENLTSMGMLSTIWYTNDIAQGVSLPDGTQILQVCFKIIGNCGKSSSVYIGTNIFSDPNEPIEVIDKVTGSDTDGVNIGLLQQQGTVTVNCFNPDGITIDIDDKDVCPGETFTLDVRVSDFSSISILRFNLKWNPDIIELVNPKVSFPQSGGCFNFSNPTVVNSSASPQGLISVDWTSTGLGCTLPDEFILMRLHFKVKGSSGSNSTISVVNPILVDKFGGQVVNIGINNHNGLVKVCELTSPTIVASSASANPGDTVCIDFAVQDFEDIIRMQYTINWEPTILQFLSVEDLNLSSLSDLNFLKTQVSTLGVLGVEWESATGVNAPDGTTIFRVCFKVIGDPGECSHISFDDVPWPIEVKTTESNNTSVGLNGQQGTVCVTNPLIFQVSVPEVYAGQFATTCLEVSAKNFLQLTEMTFSINWNPNILQFESIEPTGNLPGFGSLSYNASPSLVSDGQLIINWLSPNQIIGTTVEDGLGMFRICFQVLGASGACSPVTITGFPEFITIKTAPTGDANLGLTAKQGSVCVSNTIEVDHVEITDIDCPGIPTGAISLTIVGGSGSYSYSWQGANVSPSAQNQSNLFQGNYFVTVTDSQNPALSLNLAYEVGITPGAPIANAGQDTSFSCTNGFFLTLNGSGSSGDNIVYSWAALNTFGLQGIVLPSEQNKMNPQIVGGKYYELTVTNPLTGCFDKDTVAINSPVKPLTLVGEAELITCVSDTIHLNGTGSSSGFDILWTTSDGHIVAGTESSITPKVTSPGTYYLTLSDPVTNCMNTDSVTVEAYLEYPDADAGESATIGCLDQAVFIGGTGSSSGQGYSYLWTTPDGEVCGNTNVSQTSACSGGTYFLTVTNLANGCSSTDSVYVESDTEKPIADAGDDLVLTCIQSQAVLDGSGSSNSGNYTYTWTTSGGGHIVSGSNTLTPTIDQPGTYQLQVFDNENNCSALSEVVVSADIDLPTVAGTASNDITCLLEEAVLDADGSSIGTEFSYTWKSSDGSVVGTGLTAQVDQPDVYTLIVFNASNQCKDSIEIIVENKATLPFVSAGSNENITCINSSPQLLGQADLNPDLLIQWSGPLGNCIQNGNSLTPSVSCPGDYILTAADTETGCIAKDTVTVFLNTTPPEVEAGLDTSLTCFFPEIALSGSANVSDALVSWASIPAGLPIVNPDGLNPTISSPGTYTLTVTDNSNGCSKSDIVVVGDDTTPPFADAGDEGQVDCLNTLAALNAGNSDLSHATLVWKEIDGAFTSDEVEILVGEGLYELILTSNTNGCEGRDTVAVKNNAIHPIADAGDLVEIACDEESATLDASGSSTGSAFSYTWKDSEGNIIGSALTATVSLPGTYTLTVFNAENNCESADNVSVVFAESGEPAFAEADHDPCAAEAILLGNLPAGATGFWSSSSGAVIDDPSSATTTASGLKEGGNFFVWTLSLGNCINYSSAGVQIDVSLVAPLAIDDQVTLSPANPDNSVVINVLENDHYKEVKFRLLDNQNFIGSATATDHGTITYTKEKCFAGTVKIAYEICETSCPELCSTGNLVINVEKNPAEDCNDIPNGITPNGDGINDFLVFDILLNNLPEAFPDNEIVIFNRWGDVVYQAKPYLNDWGGTNGKGRDLPLGTYYYILRLNIANGDIIKGDVTILK